MKKERLSIAFLSFIFLTFSFLMLLSCRKKESVVTVVSIPVDSTLIPPSTDTTFLDSNSAPKTFLALGDSYTIGQSVDSSERFPAQAAALLLNQNITIAPITYIAATGWTTISLQNAIELQNPQGLFDIVTLLIGVNDQYQTGDTINYRSRFTDLLNTAISLAVNKNHVFVISIPDYGVTPFASGKPGVSEQIDLFNTINKEVADSYGVNYTDVTGISRADAGDNTMLAVDGLHPSGKQYAQWIQVLEPSIYKVLK